MPGREAGWGGMVQSLSGEHKGKLTEQVCSMRSDISRLGDIIIGF